jgi:hypothetical protein
MFQALDKALLSLAAKFAHRLQRLTGLTSYFIARLGVTISVLALLVYALNYGHHFLAHTSSFFGMVSSGICLLPLVWRSILVQKAEENLGSDVKPAILIVQLSEHWFWRMLWLSIMPVGILLGWGCFMRSHYLVYEVFNEVGYPLGISLFSYFIMVDPLPPGKSKLREWLGSLFPAPQRAAESVKA